jgi:hypothetical protein
MPTNSPNGLKLLILFLISWHFDPVAMSIEKRPDLPPNHKKYDLVFRENVHLAVRLLMELTMWQTAKKKFIQTTLRLILSV